MQLNNLKKSPPLELSQNSQLLQVESITKPTKSILKSPSSVNDTTFNNEDENKDLSNKRTRSRIETSPSHLDPQYLIPFTKSTMNLQQRQQQQTRTKSFSSEIEFIKRMLLEPQIKSKQNQIIKGTRENVSYSRYPLSRSRTERIFVKSPTPVREIPVAESLKQEEMQPIIEPARLDEIDINLTNKGKDRFSDRFAKKKLALRSQSTELSKLIETNVFDDTKEKSSTRVSLKTQPLIRIISPPLINRPNLTRQNAFTKSLGDHLNKTHQNNEDSIKRSHKKHHRRHRHHRHNNNKRPSNNQNKRPSSSKQNLNNRKSYYKSSSLTSSSSSSLTSSELATKSESTFTSSSTSSSSMLSDYTREQMKHVKFNDTVDDRTSKLLGKKKIIPAFKITIFKIFQ